MRKKAIEKLTPLGIPETWKQEWGTTVQRMKNDKQDTLILNIYKKGALRARHCIELSTGEYATWFPGSFPVSIGPGEYPMTGSDPMWADRRISYVYQSGCYYSYFYGFQSETKYDKICALAGTASKKLMKEILDEKKQERAMAEAEAGHRIGHPISEELKRWRVFFDDLESEYMRKAHIDREDRRLKRVNDIMDMVPEIPEDFGSWAYDQMFSGIPGEALYDIGSKKWFCSECHEKSERDSFKDESGSRAKSGGIGICPECGEKLVMHRKTVKYNKGISYRKKFVLFNVIDKYLSVVRYFDAYASTDASYDTSFKGKKFSVEEHIRIVLCKFNTGDKLKRLVQGGKHKECRIYYLHDRGTFDYKSNPRQYRAGDCICYPNGQMQEALDMTSYWQCGRIFAPAAAMGLEIDYNRVMIGWRSHEALSVMEMLIKGRFFKLFRQAAGGISIWDNSYYNGWMHLNMKGKDANEVLRLKDGQAINRLRNMDGDDYALSWLQYAEESGKKITQEALMFFMREGLDSDDFKFLDGVMGPDQIANYLKKQKKVSYPNLVYPSIVSQWQDYVMMANKLHKKLDDEMIYKPRELKVRHNEYAEEVERIRMLKMAKSDRKLAKQEVEKYNKRFPKAKDVLKKIKSKLEWENEEYLIVVPKELTDIIFEGRQLHHCAGATDRYFDRIEQEETYICFLRKKEHPKEPFYTIEVEPGGTIRQHRGKYDEEPDIEKVKPALREWQKEIRRRMKEEDRKKAEISKKKRAENILDLKKKQNTRVLQGLMEDLMDIEDLEAETTKELKEAVNG